MEPSNASNNGQKQASDASETATLGGGCFWCIEAAFDRIQGVQNVIPGYAGGDTHDPSYHEVCTGNTGHAEVVQVTFDPEVITFQELLHVFFSIHDPTTKDRQGADVGTQYRSIVLPHNEEQQATTQAVIDELQEAIFEDPIVTEVKPLETFWVAEDKHHDYYAKNPNQGYCRMVIDPKLNKLRAQWSDKIIDNA